VSGELFALLSALIWAISTVLWALGAKRLHIVPLNLIRCVVATVLFWFLLLFYGGFQAIAAVSLTSWFWLTVSVLALLVVGDILFFRSMELAGVSWAMPVSSINPLWALMLAALFLGEPLTWPLALGAVLVILGVILVRKPSNGAAGKNPLDSQARRKGLLLALVVSVLWATGQVALKLGTVGINSVVANSIRLPLGAVIMMALTLWRGQLSDLRQIDRKSWGIILLASFVGTGLGSLFFVYAIQLAGAGKASVLVSIAPLLAIPFSMMWLQERPTRWTLVGTVLTAAGVALVA